MTPVLFACQFSSGYGGVAYSMVDIVRQIDRTRFRPLVLCAPEGEVPQLAAAAGAQVYTAGVGAYWCYSPKRARETIRDLFVVARAIVRLAKTENVRIVHTFDGMVFFAASLAHLFVPELKVIWLDAGFNLYKFYFRLVMRWCFRHAACVATVTRIRWKQLLAEGLDPAQSLIVPYGTDFHLRRAAVVDEPRTGRLRVGIIGRIVPIKNFELFLQAARLVADRHPTVEFVIVGGKGLFPDELAYYDSIIALTKRLNLTEQVTFHGHITDPAPALASLDILVCSSHLETFGRVLIEAMALSKPIVATAVGAIPEVLAEGEAGCLVPPGDAAAMAEQISRLIEDDELRAELGRKGLARVRRHFDLHVQTKQWEQLYEGLLRDGRVAHASNIPAPAGREFEDATVTLEAPLRGGNRNAPGY